MEGAGRVQTLGFALLGGLLLGCVVAVVASISSRRLVTDYDVAEKLGVTVLDVLPSPTDGRHSGSRGVRLRHLVNVLVQRQADQPSAIAVASAAGGDAARDIAEAIATNRAAQGAATVLVHADLHRAHDEAPGLAELLDVNHPADLEDVLNTRSDNLKIIPSGNPSGDPFVLFDRRRVSAVVDNLRDTGEFHCRGVARAPPLRRGSGDQRCDRRDITDHRTGRSVGRCSRGAACARPNRSYADRRGSRRRGQSVLTSQGYALRQRCARKRGPDHRRFRSH